MTGLNPLLDLYAPPAAPAGLAQRVAAAAATTTQERSRAFPWRRGNVRWRRGALIGSAAIGFAFTSAVAAEVVSGGRIEIPVVHQVVVAIPALSASTHRADKPVQPASRAATSAPKPPQAAPNPQAQAAATPRERAVQRFDQMQQKVAERRAAGLPTPNADRIERKAKRIVERREAAGLPVPSLDQVEMRVALREWRTMRILRQVARDPSGITDVQVARFAKILPAGKRAQFLALGADQQRALMGRTAERFLERRADVRLQAANNPPAQPTEQPSDEPSEPRR